MLSTCFSGAPTQVGCFCLMVFLIFVINRQALEAVFEGESCHCCMCFQGGKKLMKADYH